MAEQRRQTLPVFMLVRSAAQLVWQQRDDALRLGLVPTLIFFVGLVYGLDDLRALTSATPATEVPDGAVLHMVVMVLCGLAAHCLMVVNWLRFVLLGPMGSVGLGLHVGKPHVQYLVSFAALVLLLGIVLSVLNMPLQTLPGIIATPASVVTLIVALLVCVRFVPFLVAIAISQPMTLRDSWMASRDNAIPLLIALALTYVPFIIAQTIVETFLDLVGFSAAAPIATYFIYAVVQVAAEVCQASVFATAFRHIVGVRA